MFFWHNTHFVGVLVGGGDWEGGFDSVGGGDHCGGGVSHWSYSGGGEEASVSGGNQESKSCYLQRNNQKREISKKRKSIWLKSRKLYC